MYPEIEYEMSVAEMDVILEASKLVPVIIIGDCTPSSPQENANRAWEALGKKMGFDYMTVKPITQRGSRFFTARPSETEEQKEERYLKSEKEHLQLRYEDLKSEIEGNREEMDEVEQKLKNL